MLLMTDGITDSDGDLTDDNAAEDVTDDVTNNDG